MKCGLRLLFDAIEFHSILVAHWLISRLNTYRYRHINVAKGFPLLLLIGVERRFARFVDGCRRSAFACRCGQSGGRREVWRPLDEHIV